jgi:pimeloyl-ACP methyl ester carboxylesterase
MPLANALSPEIALWAPDLPGHGARDDRPFTFAGAIAILELQLDLIGDRPIVILGDSLGGYLALALAALTPQKIRAVIACGCTFPLNGLGAVPAWLSDVPVRAAAAALGSDRIDAAIYDYMARFTDDETARAIRVAGIRARGRTESISELRAIDILSLVRKITVPVVYVNGERDYATRTFERAFLRAAPQSRLAIVPGVGHGVGLRSPDAIAEIVRAQM